MYFRTTLRFLAWNKFWSSPTKSTQHVWTRIKLSHQTNAWQQDGWWKSRVSRLKLKLSLKSDFCFLFTANAFEKYEKIAAVDRNCSTKANSICVTHQNRLSSECYVSLIRCWSTGLTSFVNFRTTKVLHFTATRIAKVDGSWTESRTSKTIVKIHQNLQSLLLFLQTRSSGSKTLSATAECLFKFIKWAFINLVAKMFCANFHS